MHRRNDFNYSFAGGGDLTAIQKLLTDCGLAADGIELLLDHCLVARARRQIIGVAALEPRGGSALLRSLAVAPDFRGRFVGRGLCGRLTSHARLIGVERLYLLTTDTEGYFTRLQFKRIDRGEAPAGIQATSQFRSLCPQSAVCMTRDVGGGVIHATAELLKLRPDVPGARMWAVSLSNTMLTYFEVEPNSRFESHSHPSEQITLVLAGALFFEADGGLHCVKAGEVIAIPSSVPHAVWTEGSAVTAIDAWSPVMRKYETPAKP